MMRAKMWGAVALLALGLTSGCAPTPIKVDGIAYPSKELAYASIRRQDDAYLAQLTPSKQRLGGTALVVMPTQASVLRNVGATNVVGPEAVDSAAAIIEIHLAANAAAVEKGRIFDKVVVMRADNGATTEFGEAQYKIWAEGSGSTQSKWSFAQRGAGSRPLAIPPNLGRMGWMKALNVAIINAAADLGAPVSRETVPGTAAVLPAPQAAPAAPKGNSSGSAFFVDARGHALTNAHVVEACKTITLSMPEGRKVEATVAAKDKGNDLALLTVSPPPATAFAQLSAGSPRQGEEVVVFGFPLVGALSTQGNLSTGIVSALVGLRDDSRHLQISAPVQPGNSGGPLLDLSGNVIGVVASKIDALKLAAVTGDIAQNVNFAIKANMVSNFLETNGIKHERVLAKAPLSVADVGDKARAFTTMVVCER